MREEWTRRDFMRLLSVGGVVFASGLPGCAAPARPAKAAQGTGAPGRALGAEDFFFLQLSDTHWGFRGDPNPEADVTLKKAVATINASGAAPDFVVFTGDLTQTTEDPKERRRRMQEFKEIVRELKVTDVRFIPGEHDASLDNGEAFRELFGETRYSFEHKGVHFVALDNVSDPTGSLGDAQLDWLAKDIASVPPDSPIVVLAHRPLFALYPNWDWTTRDGTRALAVLERHQNVTVFYGHIHQEHHHQTGAIQHHAARSLVFPLPAPGSVPKKAPVPWDPAKPFQGLGYRSIEATPAKGYRVDELPVVSS